MKEWNSPIEEYYSRLNFIKNGLISYTSHVTLSNVIQSWTNIIILYLEMDSQLWHNDIFLRILNAEDCSHKTLFNLTLILLMIFWFYFTAWDSSVLRRFLWRLPMQRFRENSQSSQKTTKFPRILHQDFGQQRSSLWSRYQCSWWRRI